MTPRSRARRTAGALAALALSVLLGLVAPVSAANAAGEFSNVGSPTVAGSGVVGTSFSASFDTTGVTPTPTGVDYTWYRVDTNAQIGTGATLEATTALLGTPVYVIATLSAPDTGNYVTLNSAFSNTVRLAEFAGVPQPTVVGSGVIGTSFSASIDTSGITPSPDDVEFTWYRVDTNAEMGTGASLTATVDLLGTPVYVIATLTAPTASTYVTLNSPFSNTVRLGSFIPGDHPQLSGEFTLAGTLTATLDSSSWSPSPTAVDWQWYLEDGTEITGATGSSLAMTRSLVGEVVYAVATVQAANTQSYVIATAPSGRIAEPTVSAGGSSTVAPGATIDVNVWGLLFSTEYELELQSTPVPLGSATSNADGTLSTTVTIPADTPAGAHRIVLLLDGVEVGAVDITVAGEEAELAATGSSVEPSQLASLAIAVLIAGVAALGWRGRRERLGLSR